ncbi:protein kinase [Sulfurimonas sp. SAG-AH-194-I05]|nr:serine/threonine-protein kinase [Sulfurimonas sp. SAG-AH-194-I05]MDF1875020.1 protein kinase [Sulfurimonas sp. SAG-AH-194-I05]
MKKKIIDSYKIIRSIDKGGFAQVYLVTDVKKEYALKLINSPRYINRIRQEAKALYVLNEYPNGLHFFKEKKLGEEYYFLFEYAEGGNLKKHIDTYGVLSENETLVFLSKIIDILKFAKSKGLLHLDIKPANILLHDGSYWLADWGLAEFKEEVDTLYIKGNPIFLAPETYKGKRTFASEVYALGCTLYFVITGRNPFDLRNSMELELKMFLHTYCEVETIGIESNKIVYLLQRMLDKNPQNRATIKELEEIINNDEVIKVQRKENNYPQNIAKIDVYERMAKDGIGYAQNALGSLYAKGEEVSQDIEKALELFNASANNSLACGECSLGRFYRNPKAKIKDYEKAFFYLERASIKGYNNAQYFLGLMYEEGMYVASSKEKSLFWYIESAKNGSRKAYSKLKTYNYVLQNEEV